MPGPLVPTDLPAYANDGKYLEVGRAFLATAKDLGQLRPADKVLDVGCGVGRFAVACTEYLTEDGSYDGTDVAQKSIAWCQANIAPPRFPQFKFHLIEAKNQHYAPEYDQPAHARPFDFPDETFDLVFSNSLFTHLLAEDTAHYFSEMVRVLKPGGRLLSTTFVLDDKAKAAVTTGQAANGWTLAHRVGPAYVEKEHNPEAVVAFEEKFVREILDSLNITYEIIFGNWSGGHDKNPYFGNKDFVVAQRV